MSLDKFYSQFYGRANITAICFGKLEKNNICSWDDVRPKAGKKSPRLFVSCWGFWVDWLRFVAAEGSFGCMSGCYAPPPHTYTIHTHANTLSLNKHTTRNITRAFSQFGIKFSVLPNTKVGTMMEKTLATYQLTAFGYE